MLSAWGFDAAKFREKLLEALRTKGPVPLPSEVPLPGESLGASVRIVGIEVDDAAPTRPNPPDRGLARIEVMAAAMTLALFGAALLGAACRPWLQSHPDVVHEAEAVIHATDGPCTTVPFIDSTGVATAVCIAAEALERFLDLLGSAKAGKAAASFTLVGLDGSRRVIVIPAQHVGAAHAEAKAAQLRSGK